MAVRTIYEIYDLLTASGASDLSIGATDLDGNSQTIISDANARLYIMKRYATRKYQILKGAAVTPAEGKADLMEWFNLWKTTRQHNIDKMYQALFDYNYSPIENVDRYETETIDNDTETRFGKTETKTNLLLHICEGYPVVF